MFVWLKPGNTWLWKDDLYVRDSQYEGGREGYAVGIATGLSSGFTFHGRSASSSAAVVGVWKAFVHVNEV